MPKGKRTVTLRILDAAGAVVYEFSACSTHTKVSLILLKCFVQCMQALIVPGIPITYDENRCVGSINRLLGKWRRSRKKK